MCSSSLVISAIIVVESLISFSLSPARLLHFIYNFSIINHLFLSPTSIFQRLSLSCSFPLSGTLLFLPSLTKVFLFFHSLKLRLFVLPPPHPLHQSLALPLLLPLFPLPLLASLPLLSSLPLSSLLPLQSYSFPLVSSNSFKQFIPSCSPLFFKTFFFFLFIYTFFFLCILSPFLSFSLSLWFSSG